MRMFITLILLLPCIIVAQETWIRVLGGEKNDLGYGFQTTEDGGCLVVGSTETFGNGKRDLWLIRFDSLGDTLWSKTYGGLENDEGYCIQETPDSCYIICGLTKSFGNGLSDLWLLKLDQDGDTLWTQTHGGEFDDWGLCVQNTNDNGFILTGSKFVYETWQQLWILKTDSLGHALWSKTHVSYESYNAYGTWVEQTTDSGYILTGCSRRDLWILKTDSIGDTVWSKNYGTLDYYRDDCGCYIKQDTMNNLYICGRYSEILPGTIWLIKTDSIGDTTWSKYYLPWGSRDGSANHMVRSNDGGFLLTGSKGRFFFLLKTDSLGEINWIREKTIPGYGYHIKKNNSGGYFVSGCCEISDVWFTNNLILLKTDSIGNFEEELTPIQFFNPEPGDSIDKPNIPGAFFTYLTNQWDNSFYPPFQYICEITNIELDSVVYSDSLFVLGWDLEDSSYSAWETQFIEFEKWFPESIGNYRITFNLDTLNSNGLYVNSRPLSFEFYVNNIEPSVSEHKPKAPPSLNLLSPIGSQIVLKYADYPDGFHANVFDATGRKVDEVHSTQPQGTITWGECYGPGVYFIKPLTVDASAIKVILVR